MGGRAGGRAGWSGWLVRLRLEVLDAKRIAGPAWGGMGGREGDMSLLSRFLPPEIFAAVRRGERVPPQDKPSVAIYFSDVVSLLGSAVHPESAPTPYSRAHAFTRLIQSRYKPIMSGGSFAWTY